jgi:hypothetical protein
MVITAVCVAVMLLEPQVSSSVSMPAQPPRDGAALGKGTASIAGRVVTVDGGRPIRRVQISLSSADLPEARSISTTAKGTFEFRDLPAGRYTLTAMRPGFIRMQLGQRRPGEPGRPIEIADGQRFTRADFALPRTSSIAGRITDEVGDPLAAVSLFPMQWRYFRGRRQLVRVAGGVSFNQTDDTGQFRITGLEPGEYFVMGHTRTTWTMDDNPNERIGFLPTYYPGTGKPLEAQRVKVELGQEVNVGDFPLVPGRVATISGTATTSSGMPLAGESVNRSQHFDGPGGSSMFGMSGAKVNADGSFLIKDVVPGDYRLSIRLPARDDRPAEAATITVNVFGEDVASVMLATAPGGSIAGRVVTDTGAPLPAAEARMRVQARPVDPSVTPTVPSQTSGEVREDGTFELTGVFGGASRLGLTPAPRGWSVRAIDHQGRDLAGTAIDLTGGQRLEGVMVILSQTMPIVRGTLLDDRGQPAEGVVLLFPDDPQKWSEDSRLMRSVRPDEAGVFEIRNVIPGGYLAAPVEYVREMEWVDPEFLGKLREMATRIRVPDTGTVQTALVTRSSR